MHNSSRVSLWHYWVAFAVFLPAVVLGAWQMLMRSPLPAMIARRKGVVINFSGGGAVTPFPRFSAYGASKAAVVRLTETIAEEVRESGVRVNAIAPGAVNTGLERDRIGRRHKSHQR